jgi:hypothetical protein
MFYTTQQREHLELTNWLTSIGHRWIWFPGYSYLYLLVDNGRVIRAPCLGGGRVNHTVQLDVQELKCKVDERTGYTTFALKGKNYPMAYCVLHFFKRPAAGNEKAHHINGDQTDCRIDNLTWVLDCDCCSRPLKIPDFVKPPIIHKPIGPYPKLGRSSV